MIQDFSYAWVLVEEYTSVMQVNLLALIVFVKFDESFRYTKLLSIFQVPGPGIDPGTIHLSAQYPTTRQLNA